ncbi:MAG: pyridoxamine 5'-phosphate oxidase family protein [Pseudomonadales bacterium]
MDLVAFSWCRLEKDAPDIAMFGKSRIDGKVSYLATLKENGWPRVHPVTPVVGEGACFIFAEPESSKVRDLRANGKYSLHCGMTDSSGSSGEFKITGVANVVADASVRAAVESVCNFRPSAKYVLFELKLGEATATTYRGGRPDRKRWTAAG